MLILICGNYNIFHLKLRLNSSYLATFPFLYVTKGHEVLNKALFSDMIKWMGGPQARVLPPYPNVLEH